MESCIENWRGMVYFSKGILIDYTDKFEVSDQGNIRFVKGGWPNVYKNAQGYLQFSPGRSGSPLFLHRAIASTFIPNPDQLPEVNHCRGNKNDCKSKSLEWISSQGNSRHARLLGLAPDILLDKFDVLDIRDTVVPRHKRYGINKIADRLGVSKAQARRVYIHEHWEQVYWNSLYDSNFIRVGHLGGVNLFCDIEEGFVFKIIGVDKHKGILTRRRIHNIKINNPVEIKDLNSDLYGYILTSDYCLVFMSADFIQAREYNKVNELSENPIIKLEKSFFWNY